MGYVVRRESYIAVLEMGKLQTHLKLEDILDTVKLLLVSAQKDTKLAIESLIKLGELQ